VLCNKLVLKFTYAFVIVCLRQFVGFNTTGVHSVWRSLPNYRLKLWSINIISVYQFLSADISTKNGHNRSLLQIHKSSTCFNGPQFEDKKPCPLMSRIRRFEQPLCFTFKGHTLIERILFFSPWTWKQYISTNFTDHWPINTVSQSRKLEFSTTPLWEYRISLKLVYVLFHRIYFTPLFISSASLSSNLMLLSIFQPFIHLVYSSFINTRILLFSYCFLQFIISNC
jgi:hypothetical protein